MRNELFSLDSATAARADSMRAILTMAHSDGLSVSIVGVKRDGTAYDRTGDIEGFVGSYGMSSEAVVLDTDKGPRSFNVWTITAIEVL